MPIMFYFKWDKNTFYYTQVASRWHPAVCPYLMVIWGPLMMCKVLCEEEAASAPILSDSAVVHVEKWILLTCSPSTAGGGNLSLNS
jgi:hypothetical protein